MNRRDSLLVLNLCFKLASAVAGFSTSLPLQETWSETGLGGGTAQSITAPGARSRAVMMGNIGVVTATTIVLAHFYSASRGMYDSCIMP